jgi:hypothetical protein
LEYFRVKFSTWLENELFFWSHFPSRQVKTLGLKMLGLIAFSELPSFQLGLKML